jgi:hypothetical protein
MASTVLKEPSRLFKKSRWSGTEKREKIQKIPTTSPSPVGSGTPPSEKEETLGKKTRDEKVPSFEEGGVARSDGVVGL